MRKLKVRDIAPAIRLAKAMDCSDAIKKIVKKTKNADDAGIEIIGLILNKFANDTNIQIKVAEFLASPFEMTPEEVFDLDVEEFAEGIKAIGGISAIASFFGNALL